MPRHEKVGPVYPIQIVALYAIWGGFSIAGNSAAGAPASQAAVATSIAMAESGGDTTIISDTGDYGLWQINRKTWEGKLPGIINDWDRDIYNPLLNAQAAHYIYSHGRGFVEWSTYPNASSKFLIQAQSTVANIPDSLRIKTIHDPSALDNKAIKDVIIAWLRSIGSTQTEAEDIAAKVTEPTILGTAAKAIDQLPNNMIGALGVSPGILWTAGGLIVLGLGVIFIIKGSILNEVHQI